MKLVNAKVFGKRYCVEEKRMLSCSPFDNRSKCDVDIVTRHESSPNTHAALYRILSVLHNIKLRLRHPCCAVPSVTFSLDN